ncbi:unnamed protein product [Hermetia illucens]|uniref:COP9 signalosome complex subunit 9 n=1 Tax=Hermetia illucens TaxID=343691 RepID=A0A7R8UZ62_HERIL|nr:COP9 signalosome complex subunit 9 isoform X2 [Hermetia illucens]CAD7089186.1 unnamed protein product [Hermetia illucens]
MKPTLVADEMFPEGAGFMDLEEAGGSTGILMDLATNEKHVHSDFFNSFEDLYDEEEENPQSAAQLNAQPQPPQQQQQQQPSQSGAN